MNKTEQLAAAEKALNEIEEGNPSLICHNVAQQFGLRESEVEEMYWGPARVAYAKANSAAKSAK